MKVRAVGEELFHVNGRREMGRQKNGNAWRNNRFSKVCKRF